jgi:hypothetical protein
MWQPSEEAEAFAQKSKEEWQREQEQQRLERERRRQQQIASQLSAVDVTILLEDLGTTTAKGT